MLNTKSFSKKLLFFFGFFPMGRLASGPILSTPSAPPPPAKVSGKLEVRVETICLHEGQVNALAWSPDGRLLASGASQAEIWRRDGEHVRNLPHTVGGNTIFALAWSPDGGHLVTGSADNTARVWTAAGRPAAVLQHQNPKIFSVAWSPDGTHIATACGNDVPFDNCTAEIWTREGAHVRSLGHTGDVYAVAWAPDGRHLATGSGRTLFLSEGTAKIWGLDERLTARLIATLPHRNTVRHAAWSPDGRALVSGSFLNGSGKIWTRAGVLEATFPHEDVRLECLVWSPNSEYLVGGFGNVAEIRNRKGTLLHSLEHSGNVLSAAWSPSGAYLATGTDDGTIALWNPTGSRLATLSHGRRVKALAWSPDSALLASGSSPDVVIWAVARPPTKAAPARTPTDASPGGGQGGGGGGGAGGSAAASMRPRSRSPKTDTGGAAAATADSNPAGSRCRSPVPDRTRQQYALQRERENDDAAPSVAGGAAGAHPQAAASAAALASGRAVARGISPVPWAAWGATAGAAPSLPPPAGADFSANSPIISVPSPDAARILQGFADGVVRITNAKGDELFALAGHLAPILAAAWTSDGKQLATASTDTTVKIWRTANGQELKEVRMHKGPVCALAWSADDSRVATASWDGTVKVWNPASNEVILTSGIASPSTTNIFWAGDGSRLLITKTDSSGASITETCAVGQVPPADRGAAELDGIMLSAPARDGTRILRCLVDGSGQIINAADSRLLATLTGHAAPIMAGAWAADGNQIATASSDTTVRIWNPANGDLLKKLVGHKGPVCAIAWSNDGTMVASAAWDRSVIVWHVRLGKGSEILKIEGVAGMRTTALAWTADDTKLLVTNDDGSSQMLDL